jgi:GTPase
MRKRIKELRKKLDLIQERRSRATAKREWPLVCLVGYTNAGKSTLLNAFSDAGAYVDDRLFATLDTKTKLVYVNPGLKVLMTDTVGFIRHLPHGLVASFRSTLQVAAEADLLLIVADAGHPRLQDHMDVVRATLKEIGADAVPSLLVLNKCDSPGAELQLPALLREHPDALTVSALRKDGLDRVREVLWERLQNALHHRDADREPG